MYSYSTKQSLDLLVVNQTTVDSRWFDFQGWKWFIRITKIFELCKIALIWIIAKLDENRITEKN